MSKIIEKKESKEKKQIEYFTDEMHSAIFIFPETISSRYTSSCKPVTKNVHFARNKKK